MSRYDVVVVGAGPAGLAAAVTAARGGCRVALLDSAPRIGGQFWRHRDDGDGGGQRDWRVFAQLRAALLRSTVDYRAGAAVWHAEPSAEGFRLHVGPDGQREFSAARLVIATGAYDRVLPFPGWDLPGVVTLGGALALLKGSGVPVGRRVVVAGAGPFLLPVATALVSAGVQVLGVYEAGNPRRYLRSPGVLARVRGILREAAGYAAVLARHGVPYRTNHAVIRATGADGVNTVEVARLDPDGEPLAQTVRQLTCDAVAVGFGFTPQLDLPLTLGCTTRLDVDGNLVLCADVAGQTTVPGVYAAGEVTGVGGASLALVEGRLVGAVVAAAGGRPSPVPEMDLSRLLARRTAMRRFAELMHQVHAPPKGWTGWLADDTMVCRCEEVPVAAVRAAAAEFGDVRGVREACRAGLGWCRGRVCGYATATLTARLADRPLKVADLIPFAERPFAQPVRLGDLAGDLAAD